MKHEVELTQEVRDLLEITEGPSGPVLKSFSREYTLATIVTLWKVAKMSSDKEAASRLGGSILAMIKGRPEYSVQGQEMVRMDKAIENQDWLTALSCRDRICQAVYEKTCMAVIPVPVSEIGAQNLVAEVSSGEIGEVDTSEVPLPEPEADHRAIGEMIDDVLLVKALAKAGIETLAHLAHHMRNYAQTHPKATTRECLTGIKGIRDARADAIARALGIPIDPVKTEVAA